MADAETMLRELQGQADELERLIKQEQRALEQWKYSVGWEPTGPSAEVEKRLADHRNAHRNILKLSHTIRVLAYGLDKPLKRAKVLQVKQVSQVKPRKRPSD